MSDEKKELEKDVSPKKKHQMQIKKLEEEIQTLQNEVGQWKNNYMRALADMDNAKKQNAKDQQYYMKYRAVPFLEKLLPSLDIFGSVLRNEPSDTVLKNYLIGFKYVYTNILEALASEGLKEVEVKVGDAYNENTMHALETEYHPDLAPNTVVSVRNNTFMFQDLMIRPAQVTVSTNVKKEEAETNEVNGDVTPDKLN
ncbi:MAG: nucleotide exchange factor GrpE [Bacilli bacterium]